MVPNPPRNHYSKIIRCIGFELILCPIPFVLKICIKVQKNRTTLIWWLSMPSLVTIRFRACIILYQTKSLIITTAEVADI